MILKRYKVVLCVNGERGRRITDSFLKDVAWVAGIKYGLELIVTEYVAVSFSNKNSTHPADWVLKLFLLHKSFSPPLKFIAQCDCRFFARHWGRVAKYLSILFLKRIPWGLELQLVWVYNEHRAWHSLANNKNLINDL